MTIILLYIPRSGLLQQHTLFGPNLYLSLVFCCCKKTPLPKSTLRGKDLFHPILPYYSLPLMEVQPGT